MVLIPNLAYDPFRDFVPLIGVSKTMLALNLGPSTPFKTVREFIAAHRGIEQITLDAGAGHLKDSIMPRYAELIYNGFWFAPERRMLQALIDESQRSVTGTVRLKLYKGNVIVTGRKSDSSLFDTRISTFEDDGGAYNQKDAEGFIKLNALRLRIAASKGRKLI